ncbi:MAG: glycosyl transferase [Bacteroidales bacterium]|nr:glycosyl transferase [Bacteroidales bacterium]
MKTIAVGFLERRELLKRRFVRPERYIRKLFYARMGYPLNLACPVTYNEKLQWLKLYWHNPVLTTLVDKAAVKDYVAEKIGREYIIPTIGLWERPQEIDWEALPRQFVLKCTHDSGGLVICRDKESFDRGAAVRVLKKSLRHNYYYEGFEWPYKNVKPRILAEPYLEDVATKELRDYKFFCFDGEVKALFVATDRGKAGEDVKFDFFDAEYNHLPIKQGHENAATPPQRPAHFEQMKQLAATLSKDFPHVRVDFYEANGQVYFGEMTFFHHGGWTKFDPAQWDYTFGEWLKLPADV